MEARIAKQNLAEVIASIDDVLIEILLRLPTKPLIRFKLVSKHWKSLITSSHFSLRRNPGPIPPVGLFYPRFKSLQFDYVHFDVHNPMNPTFRQLRFPDDPCAYWIHQSCHGLFLCCTTGRVGSGFNRSPMRKCYVYNPTTGSFKQLPRPSIVDGVPRVVHCVNLAFDHAKSPPFKVVCVRGSERARKLYQIEIYSPEYGSWRVSGEPFSSMADFDYGVYWNGSINWISNCLLSGNELSYFNVDRESMGTMPLPSGRIVYVGESSDHLHIIECSGMVLAFDVYEINRDYSGCFVKYRVDLTFVATNFPSMARTDVLGLENLTYYAFSVFSLIRSDEGGSFLVLQVCRKVIKFNLGCNTFEEIGDFGGPVVECPLPWPAMLPCAFQYFDSFACV